MDPVFWYLDAQRERRGPFEAGDITGLIRNGTIFRDTLVWDSSLNDWLAAADIPAFSAFFGGSPPPSRVAPPPLPLEGGPFVFAKPGALTSDIPVWGLFWRGLLQFFGALLVIPAPWTTTCYYQFLCSRIMLPGGIRLRFTGKAGDIWYIFIAMGALPLMALILDGEFPHAGVVFYLLRFCGEMSVFILQYYVFRWFFSKLKASDSSFNLTFEGNILVFFGWNLFLILSFMTIIGSAWVFTAQMRWICRNAIGSHRFDFTATGWDVLWRFFLMVLLCCFIIPIPWVLRWGASWFISKISVNV